MTIHHVYIVECHGAPEGAPGAIKKNQEIHWSSDVFETFGAPGRGPGPIKNTQKINWNSDVLREPWGPRGGTQGPPEIIQKSIGSPMFYVQLTCCEPSMMCFQWFLL